MIAAAAAAAVGTWYIVGTALTAGAAVFAAYLKGRKDGAESSAPAQNPPPQTDTPKA